MLENYSGLRASASKARITSFRDSYLVLSSFMGRHANQVFWPLGSCRLLLA